jgi:hypothetical protein
VGRTSALLRRSNFRSVRKRIDKNASRVECSGIRIDHRWKRYKEVGRYFSAAVEDWLLSCIANMLSHCLSLRSQVSHQMAHPAVIPHSLRA